MEKAKAEELSTVKEWVFKLFLESKNNGKKDCKRKSMEDLQNNSIAVTRSGLNVV